MNLSQLTLLKVHKCIEMPTTLESLIGGLECTAAGCMKFTNLSQFMPLVHDCMEIPHYTRRFGDLECNGCTKSSNLFQLVHDCTEMLTIPTV